MHSRKLEELILYLAEKSQSDEAFGKTKLNKLLFFCDFLAFRAWQQSITGDTYVRLDFGPCPRSAPDALEALREQSAWAPKVCSHYGKKQHRIVALRPPDLDVFTAREIELVDDVVAALAAHNATEVSNLSHTFVGWKIAAPGEEIPYEAMWVEDGPRPLTPEETEACRLAALG